MDCKKKFLNSLQIMQLLPMLRSKCTSKADIESRGLYNFGETFLVFEDPDARCRMKNKRDIEMLTNACFSALNHAEVLMSVEQSIISKTSQIIFSENKAVIILDCPWNISKAFDMQIAEQLFQFPHSLLIPVAINTPQWSYCLGNMANVIHLMGDTECKDFFRFNMDKIGHGFTKTAPVWQKSTLQKYTPISHHAICPIHLVGFNILPFRKLTYDELKVVVKEFQLQNFVDLDWYPEWNPKECHRSFSKWQM